MISPDKQAVVLTVKGREGERGEGGEGVEGDVCSSSQSGK
jgi:hypothetical protein